jgi:hypothetical protein
VRSPTYLEYIRIGSPDKCLFDTQASILMPIDSHSNEQIIWMYVQQQIIPIPLGAHMRPVPRGAIDGDEGSEWGAWKIQMRRVHCGGEQNKGA